MIKPVLKFLNSIWNFTWVKPTNYFAKNPTFKVRSPRAVGGGTYNLSLLSIVIGSALLWPGRREFVIFLDFCALVSILIDNEPWSQKISLRALPSQLRDYGLMVLELIPEVIPPLAIVYLLYALLLPYRQILDLGLSFEGGFWAIYGFYFLVRTGYLGYLLVNSRDLWTNLRDPFPEHFGNTRTLGSARRHAIWSYLWGNVGLVSRCGKQVATMWVFALISKPFEPTIISLHKQLPYLWVASLPLFVVGTYYYYLLTIYIFYKYHRTAHESKPLFDGLHKIHHKSAIPSLLDSGTESPAELSLVEESSPLLAFPTWLFVLIEMKAALRLHWPEHHSNSGNNQYHQHHHRLLTVNYGLFRIEDRVYKTFYQKTSEPARKIQA